MAGVLRHEVLAETAVETRAATTDETSDAADVEAVDAVDTASSRPWIMLDFCAGGGGPTPSIERIINETTTTKTRTKTKTETTATTTNTTTARPTQFVLTDLHPHVDDWAAAAAQSRNVHYATEPVDASAAEPTAILAAAGLAADPASTSTQSTAPPPPRVFRLFNLAFHHFDDPLAAAILRNTVETSDGFG